MRTRLYVIEPSLFVQNLPRDSFAPEHSSKHESAHQALPQKSWDIQEVTIPYLLSTRKIAKNKIL